MATDTNKLRLRALKKKSYASKKSVYDMDTALSNITRSLFPQRQSEPEQQDAPVDYSEKISELEKKLANSRANNSEESNEREAAMQKSLNDLRKSLTGQLESLGQSTIENDQALQDAINRASEDRAKQQSGNAEDAEEEKKAPEAEEQDAYGPHNNYGRRLEAEAAAANDVAENATSTSKNVVSKVSAKIGEYVDVGSLKYKVTNIFGQRSGANAVPGREGQHSRGIDVVGTDAQGRSTNMPIAIADGVIKNITLDGSGEAYRPDATDANGKRLPASGGYIMDVELPNGKVMRYMHLGKDVMLDKDALIGKQIKRGDILHTGDNSSGSGSQTGPHTKIAITSVDKNGKYLLDYSNAENDPTPYLFGKA
jgi:hypothetical protein